MLKCSEAIEMMSMYIDSRLSNSEKATFEEHVNSCKSCSEELNELLKVVKLCSEIPEVEVPEGFKEKLYTRLMELNENEEGRSKTVQFWNKYLKIGSTVAAALILVVVLKGIWGNMSLLSSDKFTGNTSTKFAAKSEAKAEYAEPAKKEPNNFGIAKADEPVREQPKKEELKKEEPGAAAQRSVETPKMSASQASVGSPADNKNKNVNSKMLADSAQNGSESKKEAPKSPEIPSRSSNSDVIVFDKPKSNTIVKKDVAIAIKSESPPVVLEKVKTFAAANSGEIQPSNFNKTVTTSSTTMTASSTTTTTGSAAGAGSTLSIIIKVPESQYAVFTNILKSNIGANLMEIGSVSTQDMTEELDADNKKLDELNKSIKDAGDGKGGTGTQDVDSLKNELESTEKEIQQIKGSTDYIYVTITISKN